MPWEKHWALFYLLVCGGLYLSIHSCVLRALVVCSQAAVLLAACSQPNEVTDGRSSGLRRERYQESDTTESQKQIYVYRDLCYLYYKNVQRNIAQDGKLNYAESYFLENVEVIFLPLFCSLDQHWKVTFHSNRHFKEFDNSCGWEGQRIACFPRNLWTTGNIYIFFFSN